MLTIYQYREDFYTSDGLVRFLDKLRRAGVEITYYQPLRIASPTLESRKRLDLSQLCNLADRYNEIYNDMLLLHLDYTRSTIAHDQDTEEIFIKSIRVKE